MRSSFPRNTKNKHNNIKTKLDFLLTLYVFLFDDLAETNLNHSKKIVKLSLSPN